MKTAFQILILLSVAFSASAQTDRSVPPAPDKPGKLNLGVLIPIEMNNGLQVYLAPVANYPKFTISVNIEQHASWDETMPEASRILGNTYMKKLSEKYPSGEIDSIVTFKAAMISLTNSGGVIKGMKRDVNQLLDLYSDLLFNPLITEETISSEAAEYKERLNREGKKGPQKEDKFSVEKFVDSLVFGKVSKDIRQNRELNYDTITIEDVRRFLDDRIVANNAVVVVVGDFNAGECKRLIEKYFGDWRSGEVITNEDEKKISTSGLVNRKIIVVDSPNAVQSQIRFTWNLEDAYTFFDRSVELEVLNELFGENQRSYLYSNLREDKGLCYFVKSYISADAGGGRGGISTSVRTDQTDYAIENILLEMLRIRNNEVSPEDLLIAQNSLAGKYTRSLSGVSPIPYMSLAMMKKRYNLPDDYLQNKVSNYYKVGQKDITDMARKYVKPFECLIIVTGVATELRGTLEQFGEVTYLTKEGKEYIF